MSACISDQVTWETRRMVESWHFSGWLGLFFNRSGSPLIILKLKGGNVAFWTFPTKVVNGR